MAPRDPNHPAWKTSLCRYWKEGSCFKRDSECAFRHGSEQLPAAFRKAPYSENAGNVSGADGTATQLVVWKESVTMQCSASHSEDNSTNAGPYVEKEPRYPRPTKRPRSLSPTPSKKDPTFQQKQHQSDHSRTAAVPISTTLETAAALPNIPPKPLEESPLTFSTGTLKPCVEDWLHQARMERLVQPYSLQGSSLQFKFEHDMTYRCPLEMLPVCINHQIRGHLEVQARVNIVWCAMLYGKHEKVLPMLEHTIILGHQLRKQLQPLLHSRGVTFANVLFVTQESVMEDDLKAVAHFWSIRQVELPDVHPIRVKGTSAHLQGEGVNAAHVFLKVHALDMHADISIISDVDMHVTNGETLANGLIDFLPGNKYGKELDEGGTACLSRNHSRVEKNIEPQLVSGDKGLSYCFAIFRPSEKLAMKYKGIMSKGPADYSRALRKGALSDQDLFSEVFKHQHVLLPIKMVFFPSWMNHFDILPKYLTDFRRNKKIGRCHSGGSSPENVHTISGRFISHPPSV